MADTFTAPAASAPTLTVGVDGDHLVAAPPAAWVCGTCGGRGGVETKDERGYTWWAPCPCRDALRRGRLFSDARIGRRYLNATFDTFSARSPGQKMALALCRQWVASFPTQQKGLLLHGRVGTGKTHLAVSAFRELTLRYGVACRFVDYGNLLMDLRRAYEQETGENPLMAPLVEVDVLLIDELGKGKGTEWEDSILDDLVSRRYNGARLTLFTTNYEPEQRGAASSHPGYDSRERASVGGARTAFQSLEERVGARIFSRLHEMCDFIRVDGADHRLSASTGGGR